MTIKGIIDNILFRSDDGRYSVANIISDDFEDGEMICTGTLLGADLGDTVEAEGDYYEHAAHGIQFKIRTFKVIPPEDTISIERYLASGAIKGIGPAMAKRIVKKFGADTMNVLENEPERLVAVKGISERIAREIAEQFCEKKDVRDAMIFMQEYGIGNNLAVKIYDRYGPEVYRVIKENPYKIARDIRGVGFKTADDIAIKSGIELNSDERFKSGLYYCLQQAAVDGHTYLPKDILFERASKLLEAEPEDAEILLSALAFDHLIKVRNDKVFLSYMYNEELFAAEKLMTIRNAYDEIPENKYEEEVCLESIDAIRSRYGYNLDEVQKNAVKDAIFSGVFILTGGPGTGKTTTICTLIRYFYDRGCTVSLAAPTGRAAKRMEETTGFAAKTIHRLLEVEGGDPGEDRARFARNAENPLESDVIIIDEMSMVDINLFHALISAVTPGTKLIMSGDANQLPSVGPGNVLKDLLASGCFRSVKLEKIYRQDETSEIIVNAHKINNGEIPSFTNTGKDFFFLPRDSKESIYRDIVLLVRDKMPRQFKTTSNQIQVLSPMKKGNYGVEALNRLLQEQINPADDSKKEINRGEVIFRQGDKVMQIKNNYDAEWVIHAYNGIETDRGKGIFNGDVGVITAINTYMKSLIVVFDDNKEVEYPFAQLEELEPAYAVTIHKSQGSEYPGIVIPIVDGPSMLFTRNLLYTAVTRATKCVIILGSREKLCEMIANKGEQLRYTDLTSRLEEALNG